MRSARAGAAACFGTPAARRNLTRLPFPPADTARGCHLSGGRAPANAGAALGRARAFGARLTHPPRPAVCNFALDVPARHCCDRAGRRRRCGAARECSLAPHCIFTAEGQLVQGGRRPGALRTCSRRGRGRRRTQLSACLPSRRSDETEFRHDTKHTATCVLPLPAPGSESTAKHFA